MIVIDASVAAKLVLPYEEGHKKVESLFLDHLKGVGTIIVPDLLFYEVANTLATKATIPSDEVSASLRDLYAWELQIHYPEKQAIIKAAELAKQYKTSVYDMLYAIIAGDNDCDLISADAKFVNKVNLSYVKLL